MNIDNRRWLAWAGIGLLAIAGCQGAWAANPYWNDQSGRSPATHGPAPSAYRATALDWAALEAALQSRSDGQGFTLELPKPAGGWQAFALSDSGVMPAQLASRYPSIRSYVGRADDGTLARIDISPLGLQASVHSMEGVWLVRPERLGRGSHYLSFRRSDVEAGQPFRCETHGEIHAATAEPAMPAAITTTTGAMHRSYRTAVAANHFYVQAVANAMSPPQTPTVELGLAAVVVAMNRVNQVYQQDFSISLPLIPDNDRLIFPDEAGDTFGSSGFNNGNSLNQITAAISGIIGAANYDIGHLFTTGSGGVAGLGVVCSATSKGRGTTGLTNGSTLQTDTFYIDYVAHEMGHQFGGNHTFNGTASNCGGGNRSASSAYEPGSGSTIQAYAGICGATNNLQSHSDPYFHARSLLEMGNYSSTGNGGNCSANTVKEVPPPVASAPSQVFTIPASTPYVLTGSATSEDPLAMLTYTWEQYDLGAANNSLTTDPGTGPIQRSWRPGTSPKRYLPRLVDLLAGTTSFGEILPTTNRNLSYHLTVRDNRPGGGATHSADQTLSVVNSAGPFVVTAPLAGSSYGPTDPGMTIQWNVAGTDVAPVSCNGVDLDLVVANADGSDFTVVASLATWAANSGSATVPVPNVSTTARVRVACSNNLFFNISPEITFVGTDALFSNGFDDVEASTH